MSFILEALKRVEREREAGQPRLGAVQRLLRTPRRFVWPWVFCIALAANAGVVWTLWHPVPPTAEGVGPPMTPPAPAAVAGDQAGPKTAEAGHRTTPEPFDQPYGDQPYGDQPHGRLKSDPVRPRGETGPSPLDAPPRPRDG